MLCYAFLFVTFLLNAVNIRGSTSPPVPELLTTQRTPESTTTSGSTSPPVPELLTTLRTPESTNTSAQCQRPTLPDDVILKADSYKETYAKGFVAKLECALGYTPANYVKRTIECLGDRWTDVALRCKKKTCGALKDIPNGRYLYTEGIEYGAKVTAKCDTGYEIYGSVTRTCQHNGWSGRDLECEVVKCTELPSIVNGYPEEPHGMYEFGQSVAYKCNKDFDMFGDSTITCSEDGDFKPSPPECLKISCASPDIPHATRMEGRPPYKHKSTVRYECNLGYKLTGHGSLVCHKHGWDPSPPNCTEVTCPKPSAVDNGYFNPDKEQYKYGESVMFFCRTGFTLEGASTISCSGDETFKPPTPPAPPPRCVVVTCPAPPAINNGKFDDPPQKLYNYGQAVTYSCMEGFRLQGASRVSCSEHGTFDPSPKCVSMCPTPRDIDNGRINGPLQTWYDYGETVTYSCIEGFRLHGRSTVFCSEDGTFQPRPPPLCVGTCPAPPDIDNGRINGPLLERYDYNQSVTYSCTKGFRLIGTSTVFCSEDGTFQPPPPRCDLRWITMYVILGALTLVVIIVAIVCKRKQKNSGKVAVKTEEDEL